MDSAADVDVESSAAEVMLVADAVVGSVSAGMCGKPAAIGPSQPFLRLWPWYSTRMSSNSCRNNSEQQRKMQRAAG